MPIAHRETTWLRLTLAVAGLAVFVAVGCSGTNSPSAPATAIPSQTGATPTATVPAGDANEGQQIFLADCVTCHRIDASGGINFGTVSSADLRDAALDPKFHRDPALLIRAILDGKDENGDALAIAMPRWRGKLTEQQAADVVAYLLTLTDSASSTAAASSSPIIPGYGMMSGGCMGPTCMSGR